MAKPSESTGRAVIEQMTREIKEHKERQGQQVSSEQARKEAVQIAERAEKTMKK